MEKATTAGAERVVVTGLEGVVVAETALSEVDGARGRLLLRGHRVESLSGTRVFEDVCGLFWDGALPDEPGRRDLRRQLGEARALAFERLDHLGDALDTADAMDALRAAVAQTEQGAAGASARDDGIRLTGGIAVFAAAFSRKRAGLAPVAPDPERGHAADYLAMLHGTPRPEPCAEALNAYLATVVDHGMNASTFTARVVASTASDTVSAVVAAVGALKGRLHGGAPGPVLDMLDGIARPEEARAWVERELAEGRRIMGMGHRVYRVRDPRASVLESAIERLSRSGVAGGRLELAREVERVAEAVLRDRYPDRPIRANVEFYTAILLEALGIPRGLFTATFAAARVVGWTAHVEEQRRTGRLIRPASRYIGPRP